MQRFYGDFRNQRILIVGEVNTGKTRTTLDILTRWIAADPSRPMTVLDLAPEPVGGIGGRLSLPPGFDGRYLSADIVPPRLTGRTPDDIARLAVANARAAEPLLTAILTHPHPVLVVNDASLYLQAGDYRRFTEIIQSAATVLINAYYGKSLSRDHPVSHRERRLTERLMQDCDRVIRLPENGNKLKAES
jgi:hypothetical protein